MRTLLNFLVLSITVISASGQSSSIDRDDAVRISEAYSLSEYVGEALWEGWSATPFPILLLTPDKDYLVGHPYPTDDFTNEGFDSRLGRDVYSRPRTESWGLNLLATFPAVGGLSTVVVGQPNATGKSSTHWVLTLLHEHFHQYQTGRDSYYEGVDALDLSGGDESGMWMLNYPFPYGDESVEASILRVRDAIVANLDGTMGLDDIADSLVKLQSQVSEKDFRYFSFQLWQEGVSRYTEQAVAQGAAKAFSSRPEFTALNDAIGYDEALADLLTQQQEQLTSLDPSDQGRIVFYVLGSALAAIFDAVEPSWRDDYFTYAFNLVGFVHNK